MIDKTEITATIAKQLDQLINDSTVKTPEKAKVVAECLLRRGLQPTWRLIREILGTGSSATLQNVINQYWTDLGSYLDKLEKRPELPKTLVSEFNAIWDNALQLAEKQVKIDLEQAFEQARKIEVEVKQKNQQLEAQLKEAKENAIVIKNQLQQLSVQYEMQQAELERTKKSQQQLQITIQDNKEEFANTLKAQQQMHTEQSAQLQQTYRVLEQSLQQTKQQLASEKLQQEILEQQNQKMIENLKQAKQHELDRQAKQYDSMLDHYGNEIGHLKVKLDATEKQYTKEKKKWQSRHESNIVATTESQSNLAILKEKNKQLEKGKTAQALLVTKQQQDFQQLNNEFVKLETRLEFLKK